MLQHQEFLPHPALRPFIHRYGIMKDTQMYSDYQVQVSQPLVNKGLFFYYRQSDSLKVTNKVLTGYFPDSYILAQGVSPYTWRYKDEFALFAVLFKPGMLCRIFPEPWLEFLDGAICLKDYNNKALLELSDQIFHAPDTAARISYIEEYLFKKLRYIDATPNIWDQSLQLIYNKPKIRLNQVAKIIDKSEGYFRRKFSRRFGIRPKQFQQFVRINHAINLIDTFPNESLTQIAYSAGYSDQAHFIKHFKSNAGVTPLTYRKQQQTSISRLTAYRDR